MKSLLLTGFALVLFAPAIALAQNTFNGTWKTDPASIHDQGKSIVVALKDGMFHCNCDTPAISVKADGKEHRVSGHIGYDSLAVDVVNDHSLRMTEKKSGKVVSTGTLTASADGSTVTSEFTDTSGSSPVTGKAVYERVDKAAPGANLATGTWRLKAVDSVSDSGLTFTYKIDGNTVTYSNGVGDSYTATLGGKAVPLHSTTDSRITVSVSKIGKDGMRETYMHDGKVTGTTTMTLAADGKSMTMVSHNSRTGRGSTAIAHLQ